MTDSISASEKEDMREILSHFYGNNAKHWDITLRTFELFGQLIKKTEVCDQAMNLVPRPFGGGNVIKWGVKQARKAVIRHFKKPESKHYLTCMKTTALSMRSEFELASYSM